MNEKELIEEMAKDLKECLPNNWYWQKSVDADTYLVAKHFYNTGYRKIPEGSVVLDRHEHQKYCAYKIIEPQIKGCLDRERKLEKQVKELEEQRDRQAYIAEELIQEKHRWTEQARKETAKEILKFVLNMSYFDLDGELIFPINSLRNYIAKQYEVEE